MIFLALLTVPYLALIMLFCFALPSLAFKQSEDKINKHCLNSVIVSMETNLSFCGSTHLSPVTKKQINEFAECCSLFSFMHIPCAHNAVFFCLNLVFNNSGRRTRRDYYISQSYLPFKVNLSYQRLKIRAFSVFNGKPLIFCGGKHLSPVTNKQINEFVDLQRRSVVLQELYNGRKNVKKRIKMVALRKKKRRKRRIKKRKKSKTASAGLEYQPLCS